MKRRIILRLLPIAIGSLLALSGGPASVGADKPTEVAAGGTDGVPLELVQNSDFEADELNGWSLILVGEAEGQLEREFAVGGRATNSHSLRLTVVNPGRRCGVSNQAVSGFQVQAGECYDLNFQARTDKRESNRGYALTVSLESPDGDQVFARTTLPEVGGDWNRCSVSLRAHDSGTKARLIITMSEPGRLWLDEISLVRRDPGRGQSR